MKTTIKTLLLFLLCLSLHANEKCSEKSVTLDLSDYQNPLAHLLMGKDITDYGVSRTEVCRNQLRPYEKEQEMCICAIGKTPKKEVHWFRKGCRSWFRKNKCDRKKRVMTQFDQDLTQFIGKEPNTKRLKLGFVGHWSSSEESIDNFEDNILPIMDKFDIDIEIDNTACNAGDNPFILQKLIRDLPEDKRNRVVFKGNQTISTGMWQYNFEFITGKTNVPVVTCNRGIQVPQCEDFENNRCMKSIEGGFGKMRITCLTDSHAFKTLTCEQKARSSASAWKEESGSFLPQIVEFDSEEVGVKKVVNLDVTLLNVPETHDFRYIGLEAQDVDLSRIDDPNYIQELAYREYNETKESGYTFSGAPEISLEDLKVTDHRVAFDNYMPEKFYAVKVDHPGVKPVYFRDRDEAIAYFEQFSPLRAISRYYGEEFNSYFQSKAYEAIHLD